MNTIKLHNYFRSSTSYRVRIALELKNLAYEYIPVNLINNGGDQNQPNYRSLNPAGGVPTLIHQKNIISQSSAILEYLDEAFPQTYQLMPMNAVSRAHIRQFCQIINADTHAYANLKTLQYLEKNLKVSAEQKTEWIQFWINAGLASCEKMLSALQINANTNLLHCFGENITMADVFLVPQLVTATRFEVDITKYPILSRIYENCLKHAAFIKAHPFRQIDTPDNLRIE